MIKITEYYGEQGIQYRASVDVDAMSRNRKVTIKSGFSTRQDAEKWSQECVQQYARSQNTISSDIGINGDVVPSITLELLSKISQTK